MKKNIIYVIILFIVFLLFTFCQRRVFVHVTIKGTLVDFFTNQPVLAILKLNTDNPAMFNRSGVLKTVSSREDGTFDLKSRAIWKKEYYLSFLSKDSTLSGIIFNGIIQNNSTVDLGQINIDHKFTCSLTLNSISTNTLNLDNSTFAPGTNTTVIHSTIYSKDMFKGRNGDYIINYSIDSVMTTYFRTLRIPITNSSNLIKTINF